MIYLCIYGILYMYEEGLKRKGLLFTGLATVMLFSYNLEHFKGLGFIFAFKRSSFDFNVFVGSHIQEGQ